jgi:phosphoribosyl-ATP pyrophosphohydrolase
LINEILESAKQLVQYQMDTYPQPNYVAAKLGEEAGEVIRAYIHMAEGRGTYEMLVNEAIQLIALTLRLVTEGDQTILHNLPDISI